MKLYKVGILGATGAVGQEMMKILAERNFPIGELHLLASERSVGKTMSFKGEEIAVELACPEAFKGLDIVLGAAENDIAEAMAPHIVEAGAVFVDNSMSCLPSHSAFFASVIEAAGLAEKIGSVSVVLIVPKSITPLPLLTTPLILIPVTVPVYFSV